MTRRALNRSRAVPIGIRVRAPQRRAVHRSPRERRLPLPIHNRLRLHRGIYNRIAQQFLPDNPPSLSLSTSIEAPPGPAWGRPLLWLLRWSKCSRRFQSALGSLPRRSPWFQIAPIDLVLDGGKQDQYAAAFGGMNFIEFLSNDRVIVNPLRVRRSILDELESSILVCFFGRARSSESIIRDRIELAKTKTGQALHDLKRDALDMKQDIIVGDMRTIAKILDRSWKAKKATSKSISNPCLEALYTVARERSARRQSVGRRWRWLHDVYCGSRRQAAPHTSAGRWWGHAGQDRFHSHWGRVVASAGMTLVRE